MHERGIKRSEGASFLHAVSDWRSEYQCALPELKVKRSLHSLLHSWTTYNLRGAVSYR